MYCISYKCKEIDSCAKADVSACMHALYIKKHVLLLI